MSYNLDTLRTDLRSTNPQIKAKAEAYLNTAKNSYKQTQKYMKNQTQKTAESFSHLFTILVIGLFAYIVISTMFHNNQPVEYNAGEVNQEAQTESLELPKE